MALGLVTLNQYSYTPAATDSVPLHWPAESRIPSAADRPTLLMFAHPHCPCTRASFEELNRFMTRAQDRIAVRVLFFKPPGADDSWAESSLSRSAASDPRLKVIFDDGSEAVRFHVHTSGEVLLYAQGKLLFHGGITAGRGHEGDNLGRDKLEKLVTEGFLERSQAPVFGCPLEPSRFNKSMLK